MADDQDPAPQAPVPQDPALHVPTDYTDDGVPTFDFVRDRIESRAATADGMGELVGETPEVRELAQQEADREAAARSRLEEIRRSLGDR